VWESRTQGVGGFGGADGGGKNGGGGGVVDVGQVMAEATTSIEWWVQGTGKNGFLNASGDFVALLGKVGDIARAEVVSRNPGVLSYWRRIIIRVGHFHPVMVLLEPDAHCSLRLSHIAGRARTIGSSCAWSVVNHSRLVDVGDGVLEVDKLLFPPWP
jgi:hypothetical protein